MLLIDYLFLLNCSYSLAFFLLSAYLLGIVVCYVVIRFKGYTSTSLLRLVYFYKGHISSSRKNGSSCSVCDNPSCERHHQDYKSEPWNDVLIDDTLNKAIEKVRSCLEYFCGTGYHRI